jgi:ferredoxin-NADP reductase/epoxyqueuosine reductase QueG/putative sterol carrier protein
MVKLEDHPTVRSLKEKERSSPEPVQPKILDAEWLKQLSIECGADDVGLVEIDRPELDDQRDEILSRYPWTRTLVCFVRRMSKEPVRSTARSVSNLEFHHKGEEVNEISGRIVERLEEHGVRAVNPSMGFPMEMVRYPNRIFIVAHKPAAVAAGLGHMGIHRNVIHPKFGNFILLGTVLMDSDATSYDHPIEYNPCLECNLCVATCPVGAISPDGEFNFAACYTHNYREFMGGFNDWIEQIADSKNALDYRDRISESETSSFWQSLSFGPNYKSAYCISVCPAGEDVIGPYLNNRKLHFQDVVKPLQDKEETVYVVRGSDAEKIVRKRFKNKHVKNVGNALRPRSIHVFLDSLWFVFQKDQSEGLNATYHFTFTGNEKREATIIISNKKIEVKDGHVGKADIRVTADSRTWLDFLAKERNLIWALITRKIKINGSPSLLVKFGKCFPSPGVKHEKSEAFREIPLARSRKRPYLRNDPDTGKISEMLVEADKWTGNLKVGSIIQETPTVKTFRLVSPDGREVPFKHQPGQFLTLNVYPEGKFTKRSYTIASTPTRTECIELTIKREEFGLVSRHLHDEIREGEMINVSAPSGNFTFTGEEHESIVLVAGGVGITPMMSVVRFLTDRQWKGEIYLIISHKVPEEYIFENEIEDLAERHKNLKVLVTMTQAEGSNWNGQTGRITKELINDFVPNITNRRIHICGPVPMMDAVKSILVELQVPTEMIMIENFGTVKRAPKPQEELGDIVGDVRFSISEKTAPIHERETVLEVAERVGVEIDNACRSGTCGSCKVELLSGSVTMECEDALSNDEKSQGTILACQAKAGNDVVIDA